MNVAFENPRTLNGPMKNSIQEERAQRKRSKKERKEENPATTIDTQPSAIEDTGKVGTYDVPDRLTGLEEVEELRRLCPRQWNFVS
jgi:hypothetical protein